MRAELAKDLLGPVAGGREPVRAETDPGEERDQREVLVDSRIEEVLGTHRAEAYGSARAWSRAPDRMHRDEGAFVPLHWTPEAASGGRMKSRGRASSRHQEPTSRAGACVTLGPCAQENPTSERARAESGEDRAERSASGPHRSLRGFVRYGGAVLVVAACTVAAALMHGRFDLSNLTMVYLARRRRHRASRSGADPAIVAAF